MYRQLLKTMEEKAKKAVATEEGRQKLNAQKKSDLRKNIMPVLLYCQSQKGDLKMYENWTFHEDRNKKLFYAYYSGLFCRILCMLETTAYDSIIYSPIVEECKALIDKYNWYDVQDADLELFVSGGTYGCEVPEALAFIDGVDNVAWKDSGFGNGRDAVCLMLEHSSWTFADVRGSVRVKK